MRNTYSHKDIYGTVLGLSNLICISWRIIRHNPATKYISINGENVSPFVQLHA